MTFRKYVSYESAIIATFNEGGDVYAWIIEKNGEKFRVYHTKYPRRPEPNIVVLEGVEDPEKLYFRTFLGNHPGECETEEEEAKFFRELQNTLSDKFKIPRKRLEERILKTIKDLRKGQFSI